MSKQTAGVHHITAIVGHPQENVDFYAGVLGLRLVKKTVNFDDPGTYHFYFGNESGQPGTIMTFFPWPGARQGRVGAGQVGVTTFLVPEGSLGFWKERLDSFGVSVMETERFGEKFLQFDDPHGLKLELVARKEGPQSKWSFNGVPAEKAIKGFGGGILCSAHPARTMELMESVMGMDKVEEDESFIRFRTSGELGSVIDVMKNAPGPGRMGAGVVHHIAWSAVDGEDQVQWKQLLEREGYHPTPVQDRQYFTSIYFREAGGILFEIATDPPGFDLDEPLEALGEKLKLPPWLEPHRDKIEQVLLPIEVRERKADGK
ncbi:glyoxalase family protein [Melghirimyces thermohalophilus]|uniref:Glyoxalase family protein n=1 Tax=Melghirimyces thermohalophilus TaxID=1236220 RepID=A0A1G6JN02_9BACL|nr:ring-cleaving dioxygenase [Melghirimyces thermohalophilus]SDC20051.1 glyoxalase family protein [Melghirimyces thermohalophilus]